MNGPDGRGGDAGSHPYLPLAVLAMDVSAAEATLLGAPASPRKLAKVCRSDGKTRANTKINMLMALR